MLKLLSEKEQKNLHHRYRNSDLFRHWSGILCQLEREAGEMDAVSLWLLAEKCLQRLRVISQYRDEDIPYIYNEIINQCCGFDNGEKIIRRTSEEAERSAVVVMCVVLTSLMNAVEKGHEGEFFDNKAMCVAIDRLLQNKPYYDMLMKTFFSRETGNDGKKVVITPSDPMQEKTIIESMDDVAKEEIKQMVKNVVGRTQGLKTLFGDYWNAWESLWQDICADSQFELLMKNEEPRTTDWGINQKMVCNVVGMFKDQTKSPVSIKAINEVLLSTNVRSYISNHAEYGGSNTVLTCEQHDRIKLLIDKHILSIKDK